MVKINQKNKAFTLIELIVVIAVIAILVLLAIPKMLGHIEKTKIAQIQNDVKALEVTIDTKEVEKSNFLSNSGWIIADNNDLDKHQATKSLFDRKGKVEDGSVNLEEMYYEVPSNTLNSKLKGQFYTSEGGKVYYHDKSFESDLKAKSTSIDFNESLDREQTHTFSLPRLIELEEIEVDSGDIEVLSVNRNEITVKINNGEISRKELIAGEFIPEEKREIEAHTVEDYNENGFSGKLEKYIHSGSYTPAESKTVTDSKKNTSNSFNASLAYNSGGFTGTLSKNGNATSSREETGQQWQETGRWEDTGYYQETGYWHTYCDIWAVDEDGNNLYPWVCIELEEWIKTGEEWVSTGQEWVSTGGYYVPTYTTYYTQNYSGTVTKPAVDTREYRYKGTVIKPESDTREYENYYQYNITVNYK